MTRTRTRATVLSLCASFLLAGCSGGSSGPAAIPTTGAAPANPVGAVPTSPTSSSSSGPSAYYGLQTRTLHPLSAMAMEYSDTLVLAYTIGVDIAAFRAGLTVTPAVPTNVSNPFIEHAGSVYRIPTNGAVGIQLRFTPGVTYTLSQPAFGLNLKIATPPITASSIPAPVRHVSNSPYYYGFLNHPWNGNGSLGGLAFAGGANLTATQQAQLAEAQTTLARIRASGAGFVRLDFCADQTIGHIDPYPADQQRWSTYDAIMNALGSIGVTVLPEIQQHCAPAYMHADPLGGGHQTIDTPEHYATWAGAVAAHLRSFPQVTRVEFFNEPNLFGGWEPGTPAYADRNGVGVAPFMKQGYAAVKAANPNLMVVSGALASGGSHVNPKTWLSGAYSAGCRVGVCWDEISIHNYRWAAPGSATAANDPNEDNRFDNYKDIQSVAVANGDPQPKIMLTEWGYSTCDTLTVCFDPMVQALYFAQGMNLALADPSVDGVTYVNVTNTTDDGPDHFWSHTALVNNDYSPKPGLGVYAQFATGSH